MFRIFNKQNTEKELLEKIGNRFREDFDGLIDPKVLEKNYEDIINNDCKETSIDLLMFSNYIIAVSNMVFKKYYIQLHNDYHVGIQKDKYGIENRERWNNTLVKIVKNIAIDIFCKKAKDAISALDIIKGEDRNNFISIIDKDKIMTDNNVIDVFVNGINFFVEHEITYGEKSAPENLSFDAVSNGVEYEHAVAKYINECINGWSATVSQASGDQGLDIMASRENGVTIAIQAKFYSAPVGNKAVQEVVAARGYYNTNLAAVVSNSPFTKSAIDLALASNVELIHHNSLKQYLDSL